MEGTKSNPLNSGGPPFQSKIRVPGGGGEGKRRVPNAREMVAHYESQGMDKEAASLKVIEDLQNLVFQVISSSSSTKKGGGGGGGGGSPFDVENRRRLANLEMKLDSKPGYAQTLAIGVASGGIVTALANIWDSVRRSSSSNPNP